MAKTSQKRRHFNELASRWDQLHPPAELHARVRQFVERSATPEARRILDVGCGTGVLLFHLLECYPKVGCIVELDLAEQMLKENLRKVADSRVFRVAADACHLPFRNATFDLVLCFGVLPHLGKSNSAVEALLRVLRPKGTLVVGHLMGSKELNEFHRSLGEPMSGDTLRPSEELAAILRKLGATVLAAEEQPDWYFVSARKAR